MFQSPVDPFGHEDKEDPIASQQSHEPAVAKFRKDQATFCSLGLDSSTGQLHEAL